jgi:hypothetical protein
VRRTVEARSRRGRDTAATVLVLVALVGGLLGLPRARRELRDGRRASDVAVVYGIPVIGGPQAAQTPRLVQYVRRHLPRDSRIRVVNSGGVCRRIPVLQGQGLLYWLQYRLLPHTLTCSPHARWTLYVGVPPAPSAPRATVARFGRDLILVGAP